MKAGHRIQFFDSMRGIAIILVLLFHSYARWGDIVPYGNAYADFAIFKAGATGVRLFFMISGFVILMTLGRCHNFTDFMFKRWVRLFPAMLICSLVIYVSAKQFPVLFANRPAGAVDLARLIPGLTFLDSDTINGLTGISTQPIEYAFWSLFVEVKFYAFFGFFYFLIGETNALVLLCLVSCLAAIARLSASPQPIAFFEHTSVIFFGWFAAGALALKFYETRRYVYVFMFFVMVAVASVAIKIAATIAVSSLFISTLFIAPILSVHVRRFYESRFLLFFGYISYPLYVVHENALVCFIIALAPLMASVGGWMLPVIASIPIIAVSYLVARWGEPMLGKALSYAQTRLKTGFPQKARLEESRPFVLRDLGGGAQAPGFGSARSQAP